MDGVFTYDAGVDVQKRTADDGSHNGRSDGAAGGGIMARKALGPLRRDGLAWSDWMPQAGITPGAIERTGGYPEPVDNLRGA
jgi:hypothetical protein